MNRDRIIGGFERLAPGTAKNIAEERYGFTFDEQNRLKAALADSTLTFPSAQNMLVESLSYDENGNRTKIETGAGTLAYEYDVEDRLVRAGSTEYAYDADGNLILEKNLHVHAQYAYTGTNRMKYAEVSDSTDNTHSIVSYAYDALGRRNVRSTRNAGSEDSARTVYDLYGFDILYTASVYGDGSPVTSLRSADRSTSRVSESASSAGRYVYIEERSPAYGRSSASGESGSEAFRGIQRPLSIHGIVYGVSLEGIGQSLSGNYYTGSAEDRNVNAITDQYGELVESRSYGAFGDYSSGGGYATSSTGSILADGSIPWSWTGKPLDHATGLIDFGYRDYDPSLVRFTTYDPIRDGTNWYAYARNDPVNMVDLWGLSPSDALATDLAGKAITANGGATYGMPSSYYVTPKDTMIDRITTAAESQIGLPYTKPTNTTPDFRCDNFIESTIIKAGGNPNSVLAGSATKNEIKDHIKNVEDKGLAIKKGKNDKLEFTDGAYTVFMTDSPKGWDAHGGVAVIQGNNTTYYDNSGSNEPKSVQKNTDINSLKDIQTVYGYNSFYFVPIK